MLAAFNWKSRVGFFGFFSDPPVHLLTHRTQPHRRSLYHRARMFAGPDRGTWAVELLKLIETTCARLWRRLREELENSVDSVLTELTKTKLIAIENNPAHRFDN